MSINPSPSSSKNTTKPPQPEACVACRVAKIKCHLDPSASDSASKLCTRCIKLKLECVFFQKKRGRKPGLRNISNRTKPDVSPTEDVLLAEPSLDPLKSFPNEPSSSSTPPSTQYPPASRPDEYSRDDYFPSVSTFPPPQMVEANVAHFFPPPTADPFSNGLYPRHDSNQHQHPTNGQDNMGAVYPSSMNVNGWKFPLSSQIPNQPNAVAHGPQQPHQAYPSTHQDGNNMYEYYPPTLDASMSAPSGPPFHYPYNQQQPPGHLHQPPPFANHQTMPQQLFPSDKYSSNTTSTIGPAMYPPPTSQSNQSELINSSTQDHAYSNQSSNRYFPPPTASKSGGSKESWTLIGSSRSITNSPSTTYFPSQSHSLPPPQSRPSSQHRSQYAPSHPPSYPQSSSTQQDQALNPANQTNQPMPLAKNGMPIPSSQSAPPPSVFESDKPGLKRKNLPNLPPNMSSNGLAIGTMTANSNGDRPGTSNGNGNDNFNGTWREFKKETIDGSLNEDAKTNGVGNGNGIHNGHFNGYTNGNVNDTYPEAGPPAKRRMVWDSMGPNGEPPRSTMPAGMAALRVKGSRKLHRDIAREREKKGNTKGWRTPWEEGLVSWDVVVWLFDAYHANMTSLIALLDPSLHTAVFTHASSPILFTTILTVVSKIYMPELYPALSLALERDLGIAFARGVREIGFVQALCIGSFYRDVHGLGMWRFIGYAIQLAYELRLDGPHVRPLPEDEFEARLILDRERTWLSLICYNNILELQASICSGLVRPLEFKNWADWPLDHAHLPCAADGYAAIIFQLIEVFLDFACLKSTTETAARKLLISFAKDKLKNWTTKWDRGYFTSRINTPLTKKSSIMVTYYSLMIAFEIDCISLGIELAEFPLKPELTSQNAHTPSSLGESNSSHQSNGSSSKRSVISNSNESLIAFTQCIQSALGLLAYVCTEMKDLLICSHGCVNTGLMGTCVWLARNFSRLPEAYENEVLDCIYNMHQAYANASTDPEDDCAYQASFQASLWVALCRGRGDMEATIEHPKIELVKDKSITELMDHYSDLLPPSLT